MPSLARFRAVSYRACTAISDLYSNTINILAYNEFAASHLLSELLKISQEPIDWRHKAPIKLGVTMEVLLPAAELSGEEKKGVGKKKTKLMSSPFTSISIRFTVPALRSLQSLKQDWKGHFYSFEFQDSFMPALRPTNLSKITWKTHKLPRSLKDRLWNTREAVWFSSNSDISLFGSLGSLQTPPCISISLEVSGLCHFAAAPQEHMELFTCTGEHTKAADTSTEAVHLCQNLNQPDCLMVFSDLIFSRFRKIIPGLWQGTRTWKIISWHL